MATGSSPVVKFVPKRISLWGALCYALPPVVMDPEVALCKVCRLF